MIDKRLAILFAIITLGISSIITQLIVIREFFNVFYGNELVYGIILASWLLLTGLGAYLGRFIHLIKRKIDLLIFSQAIIAILPTLHIIVIRTLKTVFLPGELISIDKIMLFSFVILIPYCLVSGFLFTLFCVVYARRQSSEPIGEVYFLESTGAILGGFLFSFILVYLLNPFHIAYLIMLVNLVAALALSVLTKKRFFAYSLTTLLILLTIFLLFSNLDTLTTRIMFPDQEIVFHKNSLYGNLVVTRKADQLNFFENSLPLFTTQNTVANEETVHYAMIQHENPKNILLISGGISGTIDEILKYDVDRIDYVELDPLIIEIGKRYTKSLENEKVNVINSDGRLFVKQTKNKYDLVVIDLPDPSTAHLNRFYTKEFFEEIKRILNERGVISIGLSGYENYMSEEAKRLNSALYNTLKKSFTNVIVIPGYRNFFLASHAELSYDIADKIKEKNIQTTYVNENYLKGVLTKDRIDYVLESVKEDIEINKDFKPTAYYYYLLYWVTRSGFNLSLVALIVFVITLFFISKLRAIPLAIFTTGFAGSALSIVLVLTFQIIYGFVYHKIGIIVTCFMLGLVIGSFTMNKIKKKSRAWMVALELMIFLYALLLPLILINLNNLKTDVLIYLGNQIIFPLLTLIIALFVGMEFPLASRLSFKDVPETASTLYNADLVGACLGAFVTSVFLIPTIGLVNVCFLVGILNLATAFIVIQRPLPGK